MTSSKIFLYLCLAFVAGVFLSSVVKIPGVVILAALIFGISLVFIFRKDKTVCILGFSILFLVLGVWRYGAIESQITNNELAAYNDSGQEVNLRGVVAGEPDVRANSIGLKVKSSEIKINGRTINAAGYVLVTTDRYPEYQYGQELEIAGKLQTPSEDLDGFNYKDYLSKDGIYSQMSWPKIEVVSSGRGNPIYSAILSFKDKLRQSIYQNLSPPQSSILGAVILGDKRQLSDDLKNELNIAGVRHITAISGMHITIIAGILMALAIGLGLSRGKAFYFAVGLLFLYIIMVGAPASALRAGIMGGLLLLGQKTGRLSQSSRAVVFVAALMLLQNPLILKLDIGFQLSFLAVMGIIYLMPVFQDLFSKISNPKIFPLRDMLSMTLAAQVFTLPILIYNFGYLSAVAPLVNVLVVPLLPLVIISGFSFGLAAIILPALGWIISWSNWLLLTYIVKVIEFFSALPLASINARLDLIWLVPIYVGLGVFAWRLRERQKLKFLRY